VILTKDDIFEFEAAIEKEFDANHYRENIYGGYLDGYEEEIELNDWLGNNPQVLMAGANLQEYVGAHELPLYQSLVKQNFIPSIRQPGFRSFEGSWSIASHRGPYGIYGYTIEKLGQAVELDDDALFDEATYKIDEIDEILKKARRFVDNGVLDPTTFVSPKLWTPDNQSREKGIIQSVSLPLIRAIQNEKCELGSLHWKQLEDIVAEILRESGMEIHAVTESPQGGRDIIARTEIVPGELLTIAIEVKHRKTVDRPILHTALHQNAHFPALMLITSGRFTAGVIQEAKQPQNRLRLFLKDGVAIKDMINSYGL
jgi:hypothetical protein